MKPIQLICALFALSLAAFSGCSSAVKLDPAGPYNGNTVLYSADLAITSSYAVLDTFLTWESTNRPLLKGSPQVTKAADNIRLNARQWFGSAHALRDAYAAAPTAANQANLQQVLAVIQAALTEAAGYMAIPPPAPAAAPAAPAAK